MISDSCNNFTVFEISDIATYDQIPSSTIPTIESNSTALLITFFLQEKDLKYRYALRVTSSEVPLISFSPEVNNNADFCTNNPSCNIDKNTLTAELAYLTLGISNVYLTFANSVNYTVSMFRTRAGDDMCNGQIY